MGQLPDSNQCSGKAGLEWKPTAQQQIVWSDFLDETAPCPSHFLAGIAKAGASAAAAATKADCAVAGAACAEASFGCAEAAAAAGQAAAAAGAVYAAAAAEKEVKCLEIEAQ